MDETDREILEILKNDGRASYTVIAEEVGVSEGTVRNRVQRLQDEGVIEKFTVQTSGTGNKAVVLVKLSTDVDISRVLKNFPSDLEVNEVTGDHDIVVVFRREDTEMLNETLDDLRRVEGVEDTTTYTVLKERRL